MVRRVVDLDAVRAARVRLDALALAHPELLTDENRERLAVAMADMDGTDGDEEEEADAVGQR
jgi:hypothetical protein